MSTSIADSTVGVVTGVVTVCSVLHSVLPPWEKLADFPKIQRYYRAIIYVIGFIALNARSTVHPSISTQDGRIASRAAVEAQIPKADSSRSLP